MIEILAMICIVTAFALAMFLLIAQVACKRKDVSFIDGYKFWFKHGLLWAYRKPEIYFRANWVKFVRVAAIGCIVTAIIGVCLIFLT